MLLVEKSQIPTTVITYGTTLQSEIQLSSRCHLGNIWARLVHNTCPFISCLTEQVEEDANHTLLPFPRAGEYTKDSTLHEALKLLKTPSHGCRRKYSNIGDFHEDRADEILRINPPLIAKTVNSTIDQGAG
jgi:hypothetical protein